MSEIQVGQYTYIIGKLNARQQFDVARRLGVVNFILENPVQDKHDDGARWIAAMIMGQMSSIPQADMDFILNTCLSVVTTVRVHGQRPIAIMDARSGLMQFDDIDMTEMLEIVDNVIQENLANFFTKLRNVQNPATTTDPTSEATVPST